MAYNYTHILCKWNVDYSVPQFNVSIITEAEKSILYLNWTTDASFMVKNYIAVMQLVMQSCSRCCYSSKSSLPSSRISCDWTESPSSCESYEYLAIMTLLFTQYMSNTRQPSLSLCRSLRHVHTIKLRVTYMNCSNLLIYSFYIYFFRLKIILESLPIIVFIVLLKWYMKLNE